MCSTNVRQILSSARAKFVLRGVTSRQIFSKFGGDRIFQRLQKNSFRRNFLQKLYLFRWVWAWVCLLPLTARPFAGAHDRGMWILAPAPSEKFIFRRQFFSKIVTVSQKVFKSPKFFAWIPLKGLTTAPVLGSLAPSEKYFRRTFSQN
jgi:hypothetical protein